MSTLAYRVVKVFTSEEARWKGAPLHEAVVRAVARERSAARVLVSRAIGGCYENGEVASHRVLDLSHNMPLKIEIILPEPELERILPRVEEMVTDGIVTVEDMEVRVHRTTGGLLPRGMFVRDVMTAAPLSVRRDTTVREVVATLVRSEFDGVPVTDAEGRLEGMVTQEDLVAKGGVRFGPRLIAGLWQGEDIGLLPDGELFSDISGTIGATSAVAARSVAAIMTPSPLSIGEDASVAEAIKIMVEKSLKRLPVVDERKRLVGMLARIDILRLASTGVSRRRALERYGARVAGATPVGSTTLLDVPTVGADTPAAEVLELIDERCQCAVVLDERGAPLGIVSDRDLLPLLDAKTKPKARDLPAGSLMGTDMGVLPRQAGVEQALELMVERGYKRLPVVDEDGKYVGMLSREELLRILAPYSGGK